jgi:hypothetical protein
MSAPEVVTESLASIHVLAERWGCSMRQLYYIVQSRGIEHAAEVGRNYLYNAAQQACMYAALQRAEGLESYKQQRLEDRLKIIDETQHRLEALEERVRLLESQNPFVLLLNALQHFRTDHLTPGTLDAGLGTLLHSLPPGGTGGALVTLTTLMGATLRHALRAVDAGNLAPHDLPRVVDVLRMLAETYGPFAAQQLEQLYASIPLPDEATHFDAPI